jgi:hypothetical protein
MSLDFQLAWPCPHMTVEEVVPLDGEDRRSLRLRQPIAGSGTVLVMVNDDTNLFIPKDGLNSAAILSSSVSGPYDIRQNEDTLTVEASGGTNTLVFGAKNVIRRTTDQVVKLIEKAQWENVTALNENGYLVFVGRRLRLWASDSPTSLGGSGPLRGARCTQGGTSISGRTRSPTATSGSVSPCKGTR